MARRVRLRLAEGGADVTLAERRHSLSVTLDFHRVYTFDRSGRLISCFCRGTYYRRGLDHRLLIKRGSRAAADVEVIPASRAGRDYDELFLPLRQIGRALSRGRVDGADASPAGVASARAILAPILAMDPAMLARDADRFARIYRPIAMLPPDQYLALVLQLTEGCSHNRCRFCRLYRNTPFRIKTADELAQHLRQVLAWFGPGVSIRNSIFLGDANALVLNFARLAELMQVLHAGLRAAQAEHGLRWRGIYSFVDAFHTGFEDPAPWRWLRENGLRGVYLGVETGCDELLAAMNKPATRDRSLEAVRRLKQAGLQVGLIIIVGLGGSRFAERHLRDTAQLLEQLPLDARDLALFSPYVEDAPDCEMAAFKPDLTPAQCELQRVRFEETLRGRARAQQPRIATYSLREFIY